MEDSTADRLLQLNREFYDRFAEAFRDSRAATEPGFERILARIQSRSRVLDLGCGQGRLASLLPTGCSYTGVDYSHELLQIAAQSEPTESDRRFVQADLVSDDWLSTVGGNYDWIVLRAVLHHIPGDCRRQGVVERAARLLAPQGRLVIANWQFLRIERLRRRLLSWEQVGLGECDVDPGDYLLDWQRNGYGIRYVHLVDEAETRQLADHAALEIEELFFADGHTNDLTLYAVLRSEVTS